MSASACASAASLLAPERLQRSLNRATCLGLTPYTRSPAAASACDPQPPVGLDPHHHLPGIAVGAQVRGDQLVQPRRSRPRPPPAAGGQLPARLVLDLHIVVLLGPVISHEQQRLISPRLDHHGPPGPGSLRENGSRPNGSVLTPQRARQPNSGHLSRSLAGARSSPRIHVLLGLCGAHPPAATGPSLHPHQPLLLTGLVSCQLRGDLAPDGRLRPGGGVIGGGRVQRASPGQDHRPQPR